MTGADSDPTAPSAARPDRDRRPDRSHEPAAPASLQGLKEAPDPRFGPIARLAAQILGASGAAVIERDGPRLAIKARVGLAEAAWPAAAAAVEAAMVGGAPLFGSQAQAAAGGGPACFLAALPVVAGGRAAGALLVLSDRGQGEPTEAERAALADIAALAAGEIARDDEAARERERSLLERERADLALNAAGLAAYDWDLAADRLMLNDRLRAMTGLQADSVPINRGEAAMAFVHPEDRARVEATLREAFRGSGRYRDEHRLILTPNGETTWVANSGVVVRGPDGTPRRLIGVLEDITARKIAEEQRETLVAELDHRVKNVLAAVQSLAAQSARKASSLDGFLKTFAGRLKSMASAHELLTATRWRGAGMRNIAAAELGGLAPGQTRWEGPDVLLTPRAANALSLALHELATNAVKFGALSTDMGRVEVNWRRTPDGGLSLQWLETGGPPVAPPTRRGFGATLLEKVTGRELGGEARIEHRREGVRAVLNAGPTAIAEAPAAIEPAAEEAAASKSVAGASGGPPKMDHAARVAGLRVLLVEDALLLALELEAGLTEAGAIVVGAAGDLAEAMRMVGLDIDAAVLDANLNGESVRPVAEALAARGVPFVFATGYGDDKITPEDYGAPVIRKPYDVTQVAAALAEVTGRA